MTVQHCFHVVFKCAGLTCTSRAWMGLGMWTSQSARYDSILDYKADIMRYMLKLAGRGSP